MACTSSHDYSAASTSRAHAAAHPPQGKAAWRFHACAQLSASVSTSHRPSTERVSRSRFSFSTRRRHRVPTRRCRDPTRRHRRPPRGQPPSSVVALSAEGRFRAALSAGPLEFVQVAGGSLQHRGPVVTATADCRSGPARPSAARAPRRPAPRAVPWTEEHELRDSLERAEHLFQNAGARCLQRVDPQMRSIQQQEAVTTVPANAELLQAACNRTLWSPPTVADTKREFYKKFPFPIPGVYNNVIQELLVQHHLIRWNKSYSYDEVFALGFVSVFDQVLGGLPEDVQNSVFTAYISALEEDASKFRSDAAKMESLASGLASPAELKPDAHGGELQQLLAGIAGRVVDKKFLYTRLFAIGVFRLLELTGAKEPKALETLVKSLGISMDSVNRDLMTYKATLSKLSAARELMKEVFDRDRQKAMEREKEKAEKAAATEAKAATEEEEAGVRSSP